MAEFDVNKFSDQINSATESIGKMVDAARSLISPGSSWQAKVQKPQLYKKVSTGGATAQMWLGLGIASVGGISMMGTLISALAKSVFTGTFALGVGGFIFSGIIVAAGLVIGALGYRKKSRIGRFRDYKNALQDKTFIEIPKLAAKTGKKTKFVQEDLEEMIAERYFLQGHITEDGEYLITSDETYRQYLDSLSAQEAARQTEEENDEYLSRLSEAERAIIREGESYLVKIKEANDSLPGEVISAKLYRLEQVIRRIIDEVKKRPGSVGDLRKLMNYYLPTTWKLIESYQEIEREPFKTQQMITTQQQIEQTIDTVNDAFEKLLDELFRDTAWDINSDISVLNSMLVQEGLKDAEVSLNKK